MASQSYADLEVPVPRATPTSAPFWQALNENLIQLQQCQSCQRWVYYPRSRCPHCLSDQLAWRQIDGDGSLYSFTLCERPTAPQFTQWHPMIVGIIELPQKVKLNTRIVGVDADALGVGLPMQAVFQKHKEQTMLYYTVKK